jgi:hypothetical protein
LKVGLNKAINFEVPNGMDFLASLSFSKISAQYIIICETVTMKGNKILNVYKIINLKEVCMGTGVQVFIYNRILNGTDKR